MRGNPATGQRAGEGEGGLGGGTSGKGRGKRATPEN